MLAAILILCIIGLVFGAGLAYASRVLTVEMDKRQEAIQEVLPGANCGGCGFAGCGGFAESVVSGKAALDGCPVGGAKVAHLIASIMGQAVETSDRRKVARVLCQGSPQNCPDRFVYDGPADCRAAAAVAGGHKSCTYGCLGLGTCASVCAFGAITIGPDPLPVIDPALCTACGKCVKACPRSIISLEPEDARALLLCANRDKGKAVKEVCRVGCIFCSLCVKACPQQAREMVNNLAIVHHDKCDGCGICVGKCPTKSIEPIPGAERALAG